MHIIYLGLNEIESVNPCSKQDRCKLRSDLTIYMMAMAHLDS